MTHDDVLHRFRLRLFALAEELSNVRAACRMGVQYYRWRPCSGGAWTPCAPARSRRALADRLAAELRPAVGRASPEPARHLERPPPGRPQYACQAAGVIAGYQAPPAPPPRVPAVRHHRGGSRVIATGLFPRGQLTGSRGRTWQTLMSPPATPGPRSTTRRAILAQQVAADLARGLAARPRQHRQRRRDTFTETCATRASAPGAPATAGRRSHPGGVPTFARQLHGPPPGGSISVLDEGPSGDVAKASR